MRQPNHSKNRSRGRNRRQGGGNPANRVYDSNGPDVRVRGTAQTVADKYQQLAHDANSAGDRVKAESYFQHAEHYLRIIADAQAQRQQRMAEQAARNSNNNNNGSNSNDQQRQQNGHDNEAKGAEPAKKDTPETVQASQEADSNAGDDKWQGHQPEFLKAPVPVKESKPAKSGKSKSAARGRKKKSDKEAVPEAAPEAVNSETDTANAQ